MKREKWAKKNILVVVLLVAPLAGSVAWGMAEDHRHPVPLNPAQLSAMYVQPPVQRVLARPEVKAFRALIDHFNGRTQAAEDADSKATVLRSSANRSVYVRVRSEWLAGFDCLGAAYARLDQADVDVVFADPRNIPGSIRGKPDPRGAFEDFFNNPKPVPDDFVTNVDAYEGERQYLVQKGWCPDN